GATDPQSADKILSAADGLGNDLQAIHERIWSSLSISPDAQRVLGLIARAEGRISPASLAQMISDEAVEQVLRSASFLLREDPDGLAIWHNSFRLFAIERTRVRFGR